MNLATSKRSSNSNTELNPMATKTERLEMRMKNSFLNKIQELADSQNISKAESMRQAIGLYAQALEEASNGRLIKFVFPGSPLTTHLSETALAQPQSLS